MNTGFWTVTLLAVGLATGVPSARATDAASAQLMFAKVCATCHGPQGEGRSLGGQGFPSIAGLPDWYVDQQLRNFRTGVRGAHPADRLGLMMRPVARSVSSDKLVGELATFVGALPQAHPAKTVDEVVFLKGGQVFYGSTYPKNNKLGEVLINVAGLAPITVRQTEIEKVGRVNLEHGKAIYAGVCASCHGDQFQGNPDPSIRAPSQRALSDWYMLRQLQSFREGVRGQNPKDTAGAKMGPIARDVLPQMAGQLKITPEEAAASVVAYIFSNRDTAASPAASPKPAAAAAPKAP